MIIDGEYVLNFPKVSTNSYYFPPISLTYGHSHLKPLDQEDGCGVSEATLTSSQRQTGFTATLYNNKLE